MFKRLILILFFVNLSNLCFSEDFVFPLGEAEGFKYSGSYSESGFFYTSGEYYNEAISPLVYNIEGISVETLSSRERGNGFWEFWTLADIGFLLPTINIPAYLDFLVNIDVEMRYKFRIKTPLDRLNIYLSPTLSASAFVGTHPSISNIGVQRILASNLGVNLNINFKESSVFRLGFEFDSALVGFDFGRPSYNGLTNSEFLFTHPGNYLDMDFSLYWDLDISRTESIKASVSHRFKNFIDSENSIITGVFSFGLFYKNRIYR